MNKFYKILSGCVVTTWVYFSYQVLTKANVKESKGYRERQRENKEYKEIWGEE